MSEILKEIVPLEYNPDRYRDILSKLSEQGEDLSDHEHRKLDDDATLQLQSDVAHIRAGLTDTFDSFLSADEYETVWHMAYWEESGAANGGMALLPMDLESIRIRRDAQTYLQAKVKETAEANGWQAFPKGDPTWRLEQYTYVTDGARVANIAPTLFQIQDGSVLGDSHLVRRLGPSHLRKWADVVTFDTRSGLPPNYHAGLRSLLGPQRFFQLENGWPTSSWMPTREELEFFEQVLAVYY
ncbi:MAG TPA: hypothetical protein VFP32_01250 [Candidatus Saccharimonadales bacterium]|nr:hypothetical protein [Candidatus Saccharimonadales bacterium]